MNWFKFYGTEYLSDPKMLALSAAERSCWITLLSYASQNNGVVKNLTEEHLMSQSGIYWNGEEWDVTKGVLIKFKKLNMLRLNNGIVTVCNWKKRQETSLSNAERQAKFRERNKDVTESNTEVTLDKNREDKNREDKSESITPRQISELFFSDDSKREEMIQNLVKHGMAEGTARREIEKFISYWTELNQSGTKQRWQQQKTFEVQRRLATWFRNANGFSGIKQEKSKFVFL